MEKTFISNRYDVTIQISNEVIEFFRADYIEHHNRWINNISDYEYEELEEPQKECQNFYWIYIQDWISDYYSKRLGNFQDHLMRKNWFTQEMLDWINKQLIKN